MAEEQAQEKTEEPSQKRLKEAREKGQIARSKDFNATFILLTSGVVFLVLGPYLSQQFLLMMRQSFDFNSSILTLPSFALERLYSLVSFSFSVVLPLLLLILFLSLLAPILMGGWVFSAELFQPKFSRLNPLQGFKRMVSLKGLVELAKAMAKFFLVGAVFLMVLKGQLPALLALANYPLEGALSMGMKLLIDAFLLISASLILIAAVDVPFQRHEHNKQLRMTKQELRDEYKETEGRPEVKSHIRRTQQEIARRRMMAEIPKANVVVTNPTHYAVALRYEHMGAKAPIVVAKGRDLIALQINQIALAHKVPLLSVPPLARALYYSTDLEEEIPHGLYVAVAQVLAYIYQLKDKENYDKQPDFLQDLPIPNDLKRDA